MTSVHIAQNFREADEALQARGFTRWNFDLDRILALLELMGDPQRSFRAVHVTGTNGKTSTARMIEMLLRAHGLRTGRYTSPHLDSVTERVTIDGDPVSQERFTQLYNEIAPLAAMVDEQFEESLTYFEMTTALAFAGFADAPVDVAVVEVGLGGETDATNVLSAEVAVTTPIDMDHMQWLGDSLESIATMKAGIIHEGASLVTASQPRDAMIPLVERCHERGASLVAQGRVFDLVERDVAFGGQQLTITGPSKSTYEGIFLPLHGPFQAQNAAVALAATEVLLGAGEPKALDADVVGEAFSQMTSPGRLERVRTAPAVLLDAAHNPASIRALVEALSEEFSFRRLIVVFGAFADKDVSGMLELLEPVCDHIVLTESLSDRVLPTATLERLAAEVFDEDRVTAAAHLPDAIEAAVTLAEEGEAAYGGAGVLVTGSVYTISEARKLLVRD